MANIILGSKKNKSDINDLVTFIPYKSYENDGTDLIDTISGNAANKYIYNNKTRYLIPMDSVAPLLIGFNGRISTQNTEHTSQWYLRSCLFGFDISGGSYYDYSCGVKRINDTDFLLGILKDDVNNPYSDSVFKFNTYFTIYMLVYTGTTVLFDNNKNIIKSVNNNIANSYNVNQNIGIFSTADSGTRDRFTTENVIAGECHKFAIWKVINKNDSLMSIVINNAPLL